MRNFWKRNGGIVATFALMIVAVLATAADVYPQSTTRISRKCVGASPSPTTAMVDIEKDGDVQITNCSGRSTTITGTVVTSATSWALAAGTAAAPSYSFSGDTDTGAYHPGANQYAITANGTQVALFSAAGQTLTGVLTTTGNIELGHASDTTLARGSPGVVTIEGVNVVTTSSTDTLTNKTLTSPVLTTPEIGNASDTTLSRVSAGKLAVEGVNIVTVSSTDTLTNKTLTLPTIGGTGAVFNGSTSGTTTVLATAIAGTTSLTLPAATDTLVGKATTDTLTNKTYDTAGTGNSFSIAGVAVTANNGTGAVVRTAGPDFTGTVTISTAVVPTVSSTSTFTNKRITLRIGTTASSATPTPDADSHDQYNVTALAAGATFGAPTGTPTDGQKLLIRIKDNGGAQTLAFNAVYRFSTDLAAPTTTVASKTFYLGFIWNAADSKWDNVSQLNNF